MNKANKRAFNEGDFKSVDSSQNIERLKNLCGIIFTNDEEKILEVLRKKRNIIEHFKIDDSTEAIESIMYDSLSIVLRFIAGYIDLKSITKNEEYFFDDIKKRTRNLGEIIAAREQIIEASAKKDGVFDKLMKCPECLKKFLYVNDGEINCLFCDYSDTPQNVADNYISNVLGISAYECVKEGGEYPQYDCFECDENSMIIDTNNHRAYCFNCANNFDFEDFSWCSNCGQPFFTHNNEEIICSNCWDYITSKD